MKPVAAGGLCGMPSTPGYSFCADHLEKTQKKLMRDRLVEVQEQVFDQLVGHVEDAVDRIVQVMHSETARDDVKLKAATTILQLVGADLTAATAHEETVARRHRQSLEGLIPPEDEQLIVLIQKVNPERAQLLRQRALDVASRESA